MFTRMIEIAAAALMTAVLVPSAAGDEKIHTVRGHSPTFIFGPPNLEQLSINAWEESDGTVRGHAAFPGVYLATPPDGGEPSILAPESAGWTWQIEIDSLTVDGNVAWVEGTIVHDNRIPENEGGSVGFTVVDNGEGANDPPDLLFPWLEFNSDLLTEFGGPFSVTGNFTVR